MNDFELPELDIKQFEFLDVLTTSGRDDELPIG